MILLVEINTFCSEADTPGTPPVPLEGHLEPLSRPLAASLAGSAVETNPARPSANDPAAAAVAATFAHEHIT